MTFAGYFKHIFIAICEYIKSTNFACADLVQYDRNYQKENEVAVILRVIFQFRTWRKYGKWTIACIVPFLLS